MCFENFNIDIQKFLAKSTGAVFQLENTGGTIRSKVLSYYY